MKEWLLNLGEKSSRTDVWVILICITFLSCLFHITECEFNPTQVTMISGMFIDLGIITYFKNKENGTDNK